MTILKSQTNKISYDEAVTALNSLQTNAITLKKTRKERQKNVHLNLPITRKNFERSGMTLDDLNKMKIIHVSGTKGKGSTCAFCESILRHSGLKTGFYSSPHLVSVTERIRINGKPIEVICSPIHGDTKEVFIVHKIQFITGLYDEHQTQNIKHQTSSLRLMFGVWYYVA